MRKATFKIFQSVIILIIMFVTLNSFQSGSDDRWKLIYLKGTWEEIDRSAIKDPSPVTASYGQNQVMVNCESKHSRMVVRLLMDGTVVSETEIPASCFSTVIPVPETGRNYEVEITSEFGGFLSGSFVAN